MKIRYFFNYKEDFRISMNVLGNLLSNQLKKIKKNSITIFIPSVSIISLIFISYLWKMRFERYISYPLQVLFMKKVDVAHIIDHQYAHLVDFINAKKKIITINDLVPIIYEKKLKKNNLLLKYSLSRIKNFDHIVSISEQSKTDLIKFTKIDSKKITVVYPVVEKVFNLKNINNKKVLQKFQLPQKPKKIIVFDTVFYKNFEYSLKIFTKILEKYPNVILIKIGNSFTKKIDTSINDKIFNFNNLSRIQMANLYKCCDLLLFPSLYEGYGIPCLEAMKCGIPVIGSNKASLKELLDIKSQFSLNKDLKIINHIIKLFTNKNYLNKNKIISINQSKNFKRSEYPNKINSLYKKILDQN